MDYPLRWPERTDALRALWEAAGYQHFDERAAEFTFGNALDFTVVPKILAATDGMAAELREAQREADINSDEVVALNQKLEIAREAIALLRDHATGIIEIADGLEAL